MAKKELVENIVKLYSKLGGNMSDVLGSRSNVTFLGRGSNPEPFINVDINMEAVGVLGKSRILDELKSPMGYLTADKLNDVQATKLYNNMLKLEEFYYPKQISNITDMATGTRNLDQEGLGALRARGDYMTDEGVMASETILPMRKDVGSQVAKRNKEGVMSFDDSDEIATPFQSAEETFRKLREQGQDDLARQLEKAMMEGPLSKVSNKGDLPAKRASAREFLVEALKVEDVNKTSLGNVISAEDVKFITEGGGGIGGDPILLVEKYFGPKIAEALPTGATGDEIIKFTKRVLDDVVDAAGNKPTDPRFDRNTARFLDIQTPGKPEQPFAEGGRAGYRFGKRVEGEGIESIETGNDSMLMAGMGNVMKLFQSDMGGFDKAGFQDMIIQYEDSGAKGKGIKLMDFALDFLGYNDMANGGRASFRFGRSAGKAFGLAKKIANINKSVDKGTPMGYGALREYGIEAEDITNLYKKIAMDRTLVGQEKTAYFKQLNKVLKNPADYPDFIKDIKIKLGIGLADGGRAGFRFGKSVFSGIANLFKTRGDDVLDISKKAGDFKNQEQTFRTGPITMDFLEKVDPAITKKFIRTRDTSGPGSYGMYDNIADMPQGLQAAEFISKIRIPGRNQIDYERAEMFIGGGVKLTGKETVDELIQMFLNSMKSYKSPFKAAKGGLAKILEV